MKKKKEIKEKLEAIRDFLNTVPKINLLTESERMTFAASSGAAQMLEWILEE